MNKMLGKHMNIIVFVRKTIAIVCHCFLKIYQVLPSSGTIFGMVECILDEFSS